jgi:hypothetical protein
MSDMQNSNQNNDNIVTSGLGAVVAFIDYLIRVDWADWITQTSLELLKVSVLSATGAAVGWFIKKMLESFFPSVTFKPKKRTR